VPALELLYRERWSASDGLGALIITPVKELAYQIFEQLKIAGVTHDFSAGCVIGGRQLEEEQKAIGQMNILVCTPGKGRSVWKKVFFRGREESGIGLKYSC
jgi:ATP-dependent RNA helicase DDX10/DBP4